MSDHEIAGVPAQAHASPAGAATVGALVAASPAGDAALAGPASHDPPLTVRALSLLYGAAPFLVDERDVLRDAVGPLMARARAADFAVARLRLAAVDLRPGELGGLTACRVLVERLDTITSGAAPGASRSALSERLALLLAFLESGRVQVRVAAGRCWAPDFSLIRDIRRPDSVVVAGVSATGAHFFSRPYPVSGPAFTYLSPDPVTLAILAGRFQESWDHGYDVSFVLAERMRRLLGHEPRRAGSARPRAVAGRRSLEASMRTPGDGPGAGRVRERAAAFVPGRRLVGTVLSPPEVARVALELRFRDASVGSPPGMAAHTASHPAEHDARVFDLAAFQEDAVRRAEIALRRWRGAVLADGVGLGKTFLGLALAEAELTRGGSVVVVAPPALRRDWLPPLRRLARAGGTRLEVGGGSAAAEPDDAGGPPRVRWLSQALLSRGGAPAAALGATLVVVDEAHGYRNPAARRYRALAALCRGAGVVLLTATPVNNSMWDLYVQLRLFAADGQFAPIGVPDLRQAFAAAAEAGSPAPILPVLREVVIRRTRPFLRDHYGAVMLPGAVAPVSLPRRCAPTPVRYPLLEAFPGGVAAVAGVLRALTLAPYRLEAYVEGQARVEVAAELLRFSLLKRLESGAAAFGASLSALEAFYEGFARAIGEGRLVRPRERGLVSSDQLLLGAVALDPLPPTTDIPRLAADVAADMDTLRRLRAALPDPRDDPKLERLRELVREIGEKVLVFTEYRETAVQLALALAGLRAGLIHGAGAWLGGARVGRREMIEHFAPRANRVAAAGEAERVDILVATDVLAEGLNLQDARCVVSYDLPWNPVRLMQRIGRVDRLGSNHAEIRPFHFVPDAGLEELLGLVRRIRGKLRVIRRTVPGDGDVLDIAPSAEAADDEALARILAGDGAALDAAERRQNAPLELEDRLFRLWRTLRSGPRTPAPVRPVVCAVEAPSSAGDRVLLCFDGPSPAWLVWTAATREAREDDVDAATILDAALRADGAVAPDPALLAQACDAAVEVLRLRGVRSAPPPRGALATATRRLLSSLGQSRHCPDAALCARADLLLERLEAGLDAGQELALRQALSDARRRPTSALIERMERALGPLAGRATDDVVGTLAGVGSDPPSQKGEAARGGPADPWGTRWRLRAAIHARARGMEGSSAPLRPSA